MSQPRAQVQEIAAQARRARLEIAAGAGRGPTLVQPARVGALPLDRLGRLSA